MLIKIDDTIINTDKIVKIYADPSGHYVIVYYSEDFFDRFEFPNRTSQSSFLEKIGLKTYFA